MARNSSANSFERDAMNEIRGGLEDALAKGNDKNAAFFERWLEGCAKDAAQPGRGGQPRTK